jgi:hypothetical protein
MIIFTAIGIRTDRTDLASFSWEKGGQITMNSFETLPLPEVDEPSPTPPQPLFGFSSGSLQTAGIINVVLTLPFAKESEVELLVPSQLEDILPFDLAGFTITSTVLNRSEDGQSIVLATVIKDKEIRSALERCRMIGSDPQQLASFGGAVSLFAEFYAEKNAIDQLVAFIFQSGTSLAVCTTFQQHVVSLREWPISESTLQYQLLADIAATVSKSELAVKSPFGGYYFSGSAVVRRGLESMLNSPPLDLQLPEDIVIPDEIIISEVPWWAIGLALLEAGKITRRKKPIVNLRVGEYSYHRRLRELGTYLLDEAVYLGLALVLSLTLFGASYYKAASTLDDIEESIRTMTQSSIGESAETPAANRQLLETRVSELEEQLKGIGSLSSSSPLMAIREFIVASAGIDVSLDAATYSESKLVLRGSVAENRMTGELEGALKSRAKKFCEVAINPRGRTSGGRIGFSAEISLCE